MLTHPRQLMGPLAALTALFFVTVSSAVGAPPQVNGKLDTIETLNVLRVWGTPKEMGFAHGYLLGAGFLEDFEERLGGLTPENSADYDRKQASQLGFVWLADDARAEIGGIFEGIKARSGEAPIIKALGRPLRVEDLIQINAGDLLRAFGCSGFTVWDAQAVGAGVITTRNFDYPVSGPEMLKRQFILVRNPRGKRKVATVTFPGYIGAFTGVNDDGVCAFMHDGNGPRSRQGKRKYTPIAFVLKDMLERSSRKQAHGYVERALGKAAPFPFSYMIRVVTPSTNVASEKPARVFRLDSLGLSENATEYTSCITTNHYVVAGEDKPSNASPDSIRRYQLLALRLRGMMTDQRAWESLEVVASSNPKYPTLHSLVVYPDQRRLDIALATWADRVIPAPMVPPTSISFLQLFSPRD